MAAGVTLNNSRLIHNNRRHEKRIKQKSINGGIGGIYLDSVSMIAGSNRIYNNTANEHGADICLEKGRCTMPRVWGATYLDSGQQH